MSLPWKKGPYTGVFQADAVQIDASEAAPGRDSQFAAEAVPIFEPNRRGSVPPQKVKGPAAERIVPPRADPRPVREGDSFAVGHPSGRRNGSRRSGAVNTHPEGAEGQ